MNFLTLPLLVFLGFAASRAIFELLPAGWRFRRVEGFAALRPGSLLLAMLAGPALFSASAWNMRSAAPSPLAHVLVTGLLACAWAGLHGLVIVDLVRFAGLG